MDCNLCSEALSRNGPNLERPIPFSIARTARFSRKSRDPAPSTEHVRDRIASVGRLFSNRPPNRMAFCWGCSVQRRRLDALVPYACLRQAPSRWQHASIGKHYRAPQVQHRPLYQSNASRILGGTRLYCPFRGGCRTRDLKPMQDHASCLTATSAAHARGHARHAPFHAVILFRALFSRMAGLDSSSLDPACSISSHLSRHRLSIVVPKSYAARGSPTTRHTHCRHLQG